MNRDRSCTSRPGLPGKAGGRGRSPLRPATAAPRHRRAAVLGPPEPRSDPVRHCRHPASAQRGAGAHPAGARSGLAVLRPCASDKFMICSRHGSVRQIRPLIGGIDRSGSGDRKDFNFSANFGTSAPFGAVPPAPRSLRPAGPSPLGPDFPPVTADRRPHLCRQTRLKVPL